MPWENYQSYWARSPLSLVANVKTPTLVVVGSEDYRTPDSEAEQFYAALKLKGVPTTFVKVPEPATAASPPGRASRRPRRRAIIAWFDRYRPRATPVASNEGASPADRSANYRPFATFCRPAFGPAASHARDWGETMKTLRLDRGKRDCARCHFRHLPPRSGSFSPYRLMRDRQDISSDAYQGRGVNTPAETKTVNYIVDQFRSAGLQPGGDVAERPAQMDAGRAAAAVGPDRRSGRDAANLGNGQHATLTQGERDRRPRAA